MSDLLSSALIVAGSSGVLDKFAAAISSSAAAVGRHVEAVRGTRSAPQSPPPEGAAAPEWRPQSPQGELDLSSLLLSDVSLNRLGPPIRELGYALAADSLTRGITRMRPRVHVASGAGKTVFLANLPHQMMSLLTDDYATRIYSLAAYFPERATVRLISENCPRSNGGYHRIWKEWGRGGLDALFIEWTEIEKISDIDTAEQTEFVADVFKIQALRGAISSGGPDLDGLRADDTARRFVLKQFTERGVQSGVSPAEHLKRRASDGGLPKAWIGQLGANQGGYDAAASSFFDWLLGHGTNPERPGWSALGSVLVPMLPDLGEEDRRATFTLIVQFRLIPPDAIEQTRAEHQL